MKTILIIDVYGEIRREYLPFIPDTSLMYTNSMAIADRLIKTMLELPACIVFTVASVTEEWVQDMFLEYSPLQPPDFISVSQSNGDLLAMSLFLTGYTLAPIYPFSVGAALTERFGVKALRVSPMRIGLVA